MALVGFMSTDSNVIWHMFLNEMTPIRILISLKLSFCVSYELCQLYLCTSTAHSSLLPSSYSSPFVWPWVSFAAALFLPSFTKAAIFFSLFFLEKPLWFICAWGHHLSLSTALTSTSPLSLFLLFLLVTSQKPFLIESNIFLVFLLSQSTELQRASSLAESQRHKLMTILDTAVVFSSNTKQIRREI